MIYVGFLKLGKPKLLSQLLVNSELVAIACEAGGLVLVLKVTMGFQYKRL
jgi:hypothetical protein